MWSISREHRCRHRRRQALGPAGRCVRQSGGSPVRRNRYVVRLGEVDQPLTMVPTADGSCPSYFRHTPFVNFVGLGGAGRRAVMVALSEPGSWDLRLDHPIEIGHGDQRLETLGEVGAYILALPATVQHHELWHAAAEAVLEAAQTGHPARVARVFRLAAIMSGQNAYTVRE
jgi:hypothetical protein